MAEVCVALWGVAGARGRVLSPPRARDVGRVWELFRRLARCEIPSSSRAPHGGPVDVSFTRTLSRLAPALSRNSNNCANPNKTLHSKGKRLCGADAFWSSFSHESRVILNYSLHAL